jgi:peptidoglycan/xylan/chitin deacetylase (PgdA/CDA1 family)
MRNWLKRSLVRSGALGLAARASSRKVAILYYHSVRDNPQAGANTLGEIIHSTGVFRQQMEILARNYNPVTLGEVRGFVRGEKDLPSRPVVVTFDDGYADNLEVAAPILNHYGIPAVVYVVVDCIEKKCLPWPARLRYAILTTKRSRWNFPEGAGLPLGNLEQRQQAFRTACEHCARLSGFAQEAFVRSAESDLEVDPSRVSQDVMLTWDQVRKLAGQGHVIGSHTLTHPNIAFVSDEEVRAELGDSKTKLERELGVPIAHFAYPGPALRPNWSERSREISEDVGYETAVTIESGAVRQKDDPLCLRRIGPAARVDNFRWHIDCTLLGRKV